MMIVKVQGLCRNLSGLIKEQHKNGFVLLQFPTKRSVSLRFPLLPSCPVQLLLARKFLQILPLR